MVGHRGRKEWGKRGSEGEDRKKERKEKRWRDGEIAGRTENREM